MIFVALQLLGNWLECIALTIPPRLGLFCQAFLLTNKKGIALFERGARSVLFYVFFPCVICGTYQLVHIFLSLSGLMDYIFFVTNPWRPSSGHIYLSIAVPYVQVLTYPHVVLQQLYRHMWKELMQLFVFDACDIRLCLGMKYTLQIVFENGLMQLFVGDCCSDFGFIFQCPNMQRRSTAHPSSYIFILLFFFSYTFIIPAQFWCNDFSLLLPCSDYNTFSAYLATSCGP